MRVTFVAPSMSRASGGLFDSIRELADALVDEGCDIGVLAARDRFSAEDLPTWGRVRVHLQKSAGPTAFGWRPGLSADLSTEFPDIIHQHGLWLQQSHTVLRWSKKTRVPRVISPHGMLDPWALRNSSWKKRVVATLYENQNLQGAHCLHALNRAELDSFRAYGLQGPVAVIPNGVDTRPADRSHREVGWAKSLPTGARVLLFLGRLHPKKGLRELFAALGYLNQDDLGPWHVVIAGWDQLGHLAELQASAEAAGIAGRMHFVGPQYGDDKLATLARADAFVLPSHSEGLPLAVLEAWAFRLPVLMTEECNLPEGFASGAARRITRDPAGMASDLANFLGMSQSELMIMGAAGRKLVEHAFTWPAAAGQMASVYAWCCGAAQMPACVKMA